MNRTGNRQSGIAIGPILFVVAILAVLASAIAAGSGAFNSDTSAVKAKAQASAILEYANEVKFAVDRLLAKGCADTQISFENPIVSGYTNPNAPSDKSCHVFDVNGGGIVWKGPPIGSAITVPTGYAPGVYFYTGNVCVAGVGSASGAYYGSGIPSCWTDDSTSSSIMVTTDIRPEICDALNTMLGIKLLNSGQNKSNGIWGDKYIGSYVNATGAIDSQATIGKMMGCAQVDAAYTYFYAVLIPR